MSTLDPSFGTGGEVTLGLGANQNAAAKAAAIQPDGMIVVAGSAGPVGGQEFALARRKPCGCPDPTFGNSGTVLTSLGGSAGANSVVVEPNGTIVVAGTVQPDPTKTTSSFALARYLPNGRLDSSFGNGGIVTTSFGDFDAGANQVLLQPDGKIVALGHTSTSSGNFSFALARYNNDGSLDSTFGNQGVVTTHFNLLDDIHGAVLQADGKIIAAGSYNTGSKTDVALARYNVDGSLDMSFGTGGTVTTDFGGVNQAAQAVVVQADGKLVVAGVYAPQGPSEFFLGRYNANGTLDSTFGAGSGAQLTTGVVFTAFGQSTNAGAAALVQLPDGTFVAGGSAGSSFALARYWGDNSPPNYALGSPNTIFVALTYRQVLGREVDQGGLTGWVNWMAQGASSARVVQGIEQSTEYRTRVVDNLYATLLGRPADPGGEAGFVNALAAGMTIEQVKAGILGSPEYFQHHGGSNALFLESLYHDLLNRPTDPGGAASWTAAMQAGMDHTAVALAIARSPEALTDLVQSTYQAELHRSADPSGLAAWLQAVENGMRDEAFLAGVAGSDEFFQGM